MYIATPCTYNQTFLNTLKELKNEHFHSKLNKTYCNNHNTFLKISINERVKTWKT